MTLLSTAKFAAAFLDYGGAVYNVKHPTYGAVGNGVTDDYAAIQAAITAAPAYATVELPPGTYKCSAGFTITTPVVIKGGPGVKLDFTAAAGTAFTWNCGEIISGTYVYGYGLRDLVMSGPGSGTASTGLLLGGTNGAHGFRAENIQVQNFGLGLTFGNNSFLWTFSQCLFRANGQQVLFNATTNSGENCRFIGCTFSNSGTVADAVQLPVSSTFQVRFIGCSFDNAQLSIATGTLLCDACHFENPGHAGDYRMLSCTGGDTKLSNCTFTQGNAAPSVTEFVFASGATLTAFGTRFAATTAGFPRGFFFDTSAKVTLFSTAVLFNVLAEFACNGFHLPTSVSSWGCVNGIGNTDVVSADRGDTSQSWVYGTDSHTQVFASTLTANRTLTLNHTGTCAGARVYVKRLGAGDFTLTVQNQTPTTLVVLGQNQWARLVFNGASNAWEVEGNGNLAPAIVDKSLALAAGASVALDASQANYFTINITSNIAVVVAVPTNPPTKGGGQRIEVQFRNSSGGALSTAPTFATASGGFVFSAVTNPANGTKVVYSFRWDPSVFFWVEVGTHLAAGI